MGYTSRLNSNNQAGTTRDFEPVGIVPLWNGRGQPAFGAFADGTWRKCMTDGHCIDLAWPEMWAGYARPEGRRMFWHGTLLEDKGDGSGLNYRRNRYYDPVNGRFTQEDPIGIAGGLNVYGFAEGDPVNYGDPYGLKVCYKGNAQDRTSLVQATEQATNTTITLDTSGRCIAHATPNPDGQNSHFRSLQRRLNNVIRDQDVYDVAFGSCPGGDSGCFDPFTNSISISRSDPTGFYPARGGGRWRCRYNPRDQPFSREATLVHELLGHAEAPGLRQVYEPRARDVQNEYHRAVGETLRCRHG